jgi:Uma2 family endonuclease
MLRALPVWQGVVTFRSMSAVQPARRLTEAEYLEIERAAEFKSEFFDGEMFAMAGGKPRHSQIAVNLAGELRNHLKGRDCVVYNAYLRIKVEATGLLTYPDLSVICGPLKLMERTDDTVVNPTVIVEVLSDSTEGYDRGKKFEQYRQIPSLRAYLLVAQYEPRVEQFLRQPGGQWVLSEAVGVDSAMEVPALGLSISLSEVYAKVDFTTPPSPFSSRRPR